MAKYLKKIDSWLLKSISAVVVGWVKKKKYTQHKYDFALMIKGWEASWWIGITLWQIFGLFFRHRFVASFITLFLLAFIVVVEGIGYIAIREQKERYDELFARRKNPIIYKMEKEVLDLVKEATERQRFIAIISISILGTFVAIINAQLLPIYLGGGNADIHFSRV